MPNERAIASLYLGMSQHTVAVAQNYFLHYMYNEYKWYTSDNRGHNSTEQPNRRFLDLKYCIQMNQA